MPYADLIKRKEYYKQYRLNNKNKAKQYYESNKEKLKQSFKDWYIKNKENKQLYNQIWYKNHQEEQIDYHRNYNKMFKQEVADRRLSLGYRYIRYITDAKRRGREFKLSLEEFKNITNQVCFYCGKFSSDKDFVGIDRINNNVGYILSNSRPCCDRCNYMKQEYSTEEFLSKIKEIIINLNLGTIK